MSKGDFYDQKESVDQYISMTEDINGKALIDKMKPFLNVGDKVLEIGSGPGNDWRILNELYNVVGSDNSPTFVKHLEQTFPTGKFVLMDASKLEVSQRFNVIYSNKVLHHLTNEELKTSVKRQSEILEEGGIICHSFWKGDGDEIFKGLFVNNHLPVDLEGFFEPCFEILVMELYAEFESEDSILLIAKKK